MGRRWTLFGLGLGFADWWREEGEETEGKMGGMGFVGCGFPVCPICLLPVGGGFGLFVPVWIALRVICVRTAGGWNETLH